MSKKKLFIGGLIAAIVAALVAVFIQGSANAKGDEPCTPADAWTETIEHPAVTHVVHHEAGTHVVHHDAVTHQETIVDEEAWTETVIDEEAYDETVIDQQAVEGQHYSLKGNSGLDKDETPVFPADYWQANTHQEPHSSDNVTWVGTVGSGLHYTSHGSSGKRDWFYFTAPVEEVSHVVHHDAVTHTVEHPAVTHEETVVDQEAYDETVTDTEPWDETIVDVEAYTETIEHPAVVCTDEPPVVNPPTIVVHVPCGVFLRPIADGHHVYIYEKNCPTKHTPVTPTVHKTPAPKVGVPTVIDAGL